MRVIIVGASGSASGRFAKGESSFRFEVKFDSYRYPYRSNSNSEFISYNIILNITTFISQNSFYFTDSSLLVGLKELGVVILKARPAVIVVLLVGREGVLAMERI